jgi:hypothetical protein
MARAEDVADLTLNGLQPALIADELGISLDATLGYLERAVGRALIRRSDICFTLPLSVRESPTTVEERQVMERFGNAAHALGDMYQDLRGIECSLHSQILELLAHKFGPDESGWWLMGIPEPVRAECQQRRESDPQRLDPYCYTDLLHLHNILDKSWSVLSPLAGELQKDKRKFLDALKQLNKIRNMVMHPARGVIPDEADFDFVSKFRRDLVRNEAFPGPEPSESKEGANTSNTIRLVSSR